LLVAAAAAAAIVATAAVVGACFVSVQKVSKQITNRYKPFAPVLCIYAHYPLEFDL
jgi:hypothetical protein